MFIRFSGALALALSLLAPLPAQARDFTIGAIKVSQPWSRATPAGAKVAGGYMTITNTGRETDRLIGGSAEIARIFEVHEMAMEGGVMKMRALEKGLEIRPGTTVELKPGGYHVMLIELAAPLKQGDRIKGHLIFEKAGRIEVEYVVGARGATGAAQAGGHGH